jgi:hypothetical protein
MNRSMLVSLASLTLALFVGGCAADFEGQEQPGNEQGTNAFLEESSALGRFTNEGASQKVEGVSSIQDQAAENVLGVPAMQDPRTQAAEDRVQAAGAEHNANSALKGL